MYLIKILLATQINSTDTIHIQFLDDCETDFRGHWPQEVKDEDLKWIANSKEDGSGPKYRLFTTQDVRVVEPDLAYHCKYNVQPGRSIVSLKYRFVILKSTYLDYLGNYPHVTAA